MMDMKPIILTGRDFVEEIDRTIEERKKWKGESWTEGEEDSWESIIRALEQLKKRLDVKNRWVV
jgi:hypothetical protein